MKVALVAPYKFMDKYNSTGFYCMYADQAAAIPGYETWFLKKLAMGSEVILDYSHKVPRSYRYIPDIEEYANLIRSIKPTYAVLPDVEFSHQKTVLATDQFFLKYSRGTPRIIPQSTKLVGILHGTTETELKLCYRDILSYSDIIGLAGSSEKVISRSKLITSLKIRKPIILFGVYKDPISEIPPQKNVIGIVTSFPLRLAYCGRLLSEFRVSPKQLDFNMVEESNPMIAERNVKQFLEACR